MIAAGIGDGKLDAAKRHRVIQGAAANLTKYYIDPEVAQKMADALRAHEKNEDDDAATDGEVFADLLTTQMREVSHDRYVMMVYSTGTTPENPPAPTAKEVARYRKEMLREQLHDRNGQDLAAQYRLCEIQRVSRCCRLRDDCSDCDGFLEPLGCDHF